jgi:hypothetical protein
MLFDLELPSDDSAATRLEWANERLWDLAEGKISKEVGALIASMLVGWTDIGCTDHERTQYLKMAKAFNEQLQAERGD